jgi:hypothetical protein
MTRKHGGKRTREKQKTSKHENEKTAPTKKKHVGLSSAGSSWLLATLSDVLENRRKKSWLTSYHRYLHGWLNSASEKSSLLPISSTILL